MTDRPSYDELAGRLAVAEQTLAAIRGGEVDALVLAGPDGPQVYSLDGADAFYRVLVEQMPVGAAAVRPDGAVLYANGTFAQMLDVPLESLIGADLAGFAASEEHRATLAGLLGGRAVGGDVVLAGAGGRGVETGLSVRAVGRGAGDVVCVVAVDLTARRAEADALREARFRAEQANRAKNAFLSQMSHELRTPLNVILGFCQLLEFDALTEEQRESVEGIGSSGQLLLELITDVLEFSRIESGDVHVELGAVGVVEVVEEAVRALRPQADELGIAVTAAWGPDAAGLHVRADRRRVRQILLNLLSNAVKYNGERGTVTVTAVRAADGLCRIAVADTGPGIAPEERGRLFTPFERLGAERGSIQGTGLGLAVSRSLAEAMGGRLRLGTQTGPGSTFLLDLPAAAVPLVRGAPEGGDAAVASAGVDPGPRGTVLYIEDNATNVRVLGAVLRRRPNVMLVVAETAGEGLRRARDCDPDLILLDRQLPDRPGEEVLGELLQDPRTATVPIVIATADAGPGDAARLIAAGASDYVTKPIDMRWLLGLVDRVCGARP